jgi:hypothetical protein
LLNSHDVPRGSSPAARRVSLSATLPPIGKPRLLTPEVILRTEAHQSGHAKVATYSVPGRVLGDPTRTAAEELAAYRKPEQARSRSGNACAKWATQERNQTRGIRISNELQGCWRDTAYIYVSWIPRGGLTALRCHPKFDRALPCSIPRAPTRQTMPWIRRPCDVPADRSG